MSTFEILSGCTYCWGTGKTPAFAPGGEAQSDCPKCGGSGKVEAGQIDDIESAFTDLLNKCNDILEKCNDILEEVQGG